MKLQAASVNKNPTFLHQRFSSAHGETAHLKQDGVQLLHLAKFTEAAAAAGIQMQVEAFISEFAPFLIDFFMRNITARFPLRILEEANADAAAWQGSCLIIVILVLHRGRRAGIPVKTENNVVQTASRIQSLASSCRQTLLCLQNGWCQGETGGI